jgi:hypothetical protein
MFHALLRPAPCKGASQPRRCGDCLGLETYCYEASTHTARSPCLFTSRSPKCEHAAAYVYDAKIFGKRERVRERKKEKEKEKRDSQRQTERREREEIGRAQQKEYVWGAVPVLKCLSDREKERKRERERERERERARRHLFRWTHDRRLLVLCV